METHDVQGFMAEMLVDLNGFFGFDAVREQRSDQIAFAAVFQVRLPDNLQLFWGDALYLQQLLRRLVEHVKGVRAKRMVDALGSFRADPFDQGGQVSHNAFFAGCYDFFVGL